MVNRLSLGKNGAPSLRTGCISCQWTSSWIKMKVYPCKWALSQVKMDLFPCQWALLR